MRKKAKNGIGQATKKVKDALNINKYNKWLFIFETVLLVGVIDEYFESLISSLSLNFYLHVLLMMLAVGILFTILFKFIEPILRRIVIITVRLRASKFLRILLHVIILTVLYYLYALVFFGQKVGFSGIIG